MIHRISNKLKRLSNEFRMNSIPSRSSFAQNREPIILMYHGVVPENERLFNTRHALLKDFEHQISYLKKQCNILSLDDFFAKKFDPNKRNVAITFDDGYQNNFSYAKPILEKHMVPATFFITGLNKTSERILWADLVDIASRLGNIAPFELNTHTFQQSDQGALVNETGSNIHEFIKQQHPNFETKQDLFRQLEPYTSFLKDTTYDPYWKLMSDEEIVETSKSAYITIGSHGFYHNNLGNIALDLAKKELLDSKEYLENLTQKDVNTLGYPDGSYSRALVDYGDQIGFNVQVSTEKYLFEEDGADARIISRRGIYACDTWGNQLGQ